MTTRRKRAIQVERGPNGICQVTLESDRLEECIAEVRRLGARYVAGHQMFGFRETDLNFLTQMPSLLGVNFWEHEFENIDGIYSHSDLRDFTVEPKRPGIDFSRLPHIERMKWVWVTKDSGVGSLENLSYLDFYQYKPRERSFEGLKLPSSIRELDISFANPTSLAGFPVLPQLTKVRIQYCRNLETIADLPRIAPQLEFLVVGYCGRVKDAVAVAKQLPKLTHAAIDGKKVI